MPARGPTTFGWDPVFEPAAELQLANVTHTYAEMDKDHKNTISHRYRALDQLRTYVTAHADEIATSLASKSA